MRRAKLIGVALLGLVIGCGEVSSNQACEPADSTFAAIQQNIFVSNGCTNSVCHGQPAATAPANLDLRADVAFESLVGVDGKSADMPLVFPGDQSLSLLYLKLAATTRAELMAQGISGEPMPAGGQPALTESELEAIATWIRGGASETAVVSGTEEFFACGEAPKADPNKIQPLTAPEPAVGTQFYSGAYPLPSGSETENCFVSYYDLSAVVPADVRFPCTNAKWGEGRECFGSGRNELAQDAQSHHSIITIYTPDLSPNDVSWGDWTCLGGANHGQACSPTAIGSCGERSNCTTQVEESAACTAYDNAPQNFGGISLSSQTNTRIGFNGAQESTFVDEPLQGVYSVQPVKGFLVWNSHAFNLTDKDTTIEQWVNVDYVKLADQRWEGRRIFDVSRIFAMGKVAPYTSREVCHSVTLDRYARLMSLGSHMHQHGVEFRIWLPGDLLSGAITPCLEPDSIFQSDPNCNREDVESSYINFLYDDPVYNYYDPPVAFDSENPAERTLKMCAIYDNGDLDPATLYLNSTASQSSLCESQPFGGRATSCGCSPAQRSCVGGPTPGEPCGGDDAVCGQGGTCDACKVSGGLTTNDEMFVMLGSYFVQPPTDG